MFLAHCEYLGSDVLIWASDLEAIENTAAGMVVYYRCACGREAEMLAGASMPDRVSVHV